MRPAFAYHRPATVQDACRILADEPRAAVLAGGTDLMVHLTQSWRAKRPPAVVNVKRIPGLDAIQAIRAEDPNARIIVLTMYQGDEDIFRALKSGAATYLLKDTPSDELVRVVREVHRGASTLPPNVAQRLASRQLDEGLTSREMEVLRLTAAGMRNKEIAAALSISQETVQGHLKKILRKLEVNDRTAIQIAEEVGAVTNSGNMVPFIPFNFSPATAVPRSIVHPKHNIGSEAFQCVAARQIGGRRPV